MSANWMSGAPLSFEKRAAAIVEDLRTVRHPDAQETADLIEKLAALKNATECLMIELGFKGEISTRHPLVDVVMNALLDVDPK
jgi:hypothetical protein